MLSVIKRAEGDSIRNTTRINGRLSNIKSYRNITEPCIVQALESDDLLPTKYISLTFHSFFGEIKMLLSEVILCSSNFKLLKEVSAPYPIKVLRPKYRLRSSPSVQDNNIISELKKSIIRTAYTEKENSTGRVWSFVAIHTPSINDGYFHIDQRDDLKASKWRETKHIGWISKRISKH